MWCIHPELDMVRERERCEGPSTVTPHHWGFAPAISSPRTRLCMPVGGASESAARVVRQASGGASIMSMHSSGVARACSTVSQRCSLKAQHRQISLLQNERTSSNTPAASDVCQPDGSQQWQGRHLSEPESLLSRLRKVRFTTTCRPGQAVSRAHKGNVERCGHVSRAPTLGLRRCTCPAPAL